MRQSSYPSSHTTSYIPDSVMLIGSSEKPEFWSATEADDIVSTLVSGMSGSFWQDASKRTNKKKGRIFFISFNV